jgi:phenylpropionate dioxygenase-like ring-hydroxylating dioxygenase large terminal subunit
VSDILRYFHPALLARKLGRGPKKVVVNGQAFAFFRDQDGRARALRDRCPHRFAPLSAGRVRSDGRLACPYHGWHFDGEGRGKSPALPQLTGCDVQAFDVVERDGFLWLGRSGGAQMPVQDTAGYELAGSFAMRFDAPLFVALDNFCEDEHTPYVHTYLGWLERDVSTVEFEAENGADFTRVRYRARQRPAPIARLVGVRSGDWFHNDWVTRFDPVSTTYEIFWTCPDTGTRRPISLRVPVYFVPIDENTTQLSTIVFARSDLGSLPRPVMALLKKLAVGLVWNEFKDDRAFVKNVKDTPFDMKGMRLGKFDKPLIHNHKLLERLYWGRAPEDAETQGKHA